MLSTFAKSKRNPITSSYSTGDLNEEIALATYPPPSHYTAPNSPETLSDLSTAEQDRLRQSQRTVNHFNRGGKMKFSHSLLFNAVPEWTSFYVNYEHLKSTIYRFEKNALLATAKSPSTPAYTDNPDELESARLLSSHIPAHYDATSPSANEKVFIRLLDKEVRKIVEFYEVKEKELLNDLIMLKADIERIEDEEEAHYSGIGGTALSGDSDEEREEDEEYEGTLPIGAGAKARGALQNVFTNPASYAEATRLGRKARNASTLRPERHRTISGGSVKSGGGLHGSDDDQPQHDARTMPVSPIKPRRASISRRRSQSRMTRTSKSALYSKYEDDEDGADGIWNSHSDWAIDMKIMYKRRVTAVFTSLSELKQYVNLNYTGLSKILKKYDKITTSLLRTHYMQTVVDVQYPFQSSTQAHLTEAIGELIPTYAKIVTQGDEKSALIQLQAHLREHVVWERNTVWREMIGLERRGWGTGARGKTSGQAPMIEGQKGEVLKREIDTPVGRFVLPRWLTSQVFAGAFAIAVFVALLNAPWFDRIEERNCLALLAFVTIFWALEVVPLFVTALMVPLLVVVLRVLRSADGLDKRLTAGEATKYIFGQMFSPTIMLLLGGFTLAAALSKQNIDKVLATKVLSFAGTKPRSVLLAYMCVACFASMWISNVAAPVLCYSLIQPILRTLPTKSPFSKSLILGIALASNIGGMASPISSPQNLIALEYMNPPISWLGWFAVSIPVASTSIFFIWLILLWSYRKGSDVIINPVRINREKWRGEQWFVAIVTIVTIVLWCVEASLKDIVGDMGIIAIFPIVAFYGSGVLRKADFDHSPWSIVFLAMGGIGLGKAVLSSGLLEDLDHVIQRVVLGLDIWPILALFSVIVLVIATLISHTIASVLVVPIAAQIGTAMETPHPRLLILATALICSAGMGLPISGFPNLQAINVEDDMGQRYLEPSDFFKNGIPASIVAVIVIITVGYSIMRLMGM